MQLLRLPEDVFDARILTTGATASNVLGMGESAALPLPSTRTALTALAI